MNAMRRQRAELIISLEALMSEADMQNPEYFPRWVCWYQPAEQADEESSTQNGVINGVSTKLDGVARALQAETTQQSDKHSAENSQLQTELSELKQDMSELKQDMSTKIGKVTADVDTKLDALQTEMNAKLDALLAAVTVASRASEPEAEAEPLTPRGEAREWVGEWIEEWVSKAVPKPEPELKPEL
eukprot:COSAG06_NODE_8748_length_2080_cov_1.456840_1_plen_186_part_10